METVNLLKSAIYDCIVTRKRKMKYANAFINHFSDIMLGIVCHIYKDEAVSCLSN